MLARVAAAWVAAVLVLLGVHMLLPQPAGVIALTEVLEPYIVLSALLALPFALRRRVGWRTLLASVLIVVVVIRYGAPLLSLPRSGAGGPTLSVATWNMLSADDAAGRAVAGVSGVDADLVAIQELRIEAARALESDPALAARYPHRVLAPEQTVLGMGLLSRHTILEQQTWSEPPLIRAVVATGIGSAVVYVGHPLPARFQSVLRVPIGLDTTQRDADIAFVRSLIDSDLLERRDVIVLGDFNVTEREPAYASLARDLKDAHGSAGIGPGFSWRPPALRALPFGLIRIDYVLTSETLEAVSTHVDCSRPSDHCMVLATLFRALSYGVPAT